MERRFSVANLNSENFSPVFWLMLQSLSSSFILMMIEASSQKIGIFWVQVGIVHSPSSERCLFRSSLIQTSLIQILPYPKSPNNDVHRYFAVQQMENSLFRIQIALFLLSEHFCCSNTHLHKGVQISEDTLQEITSIPASNWRNVVTVDQYSCL